jgi:single-stranded-DNA-specific exonuclease
MEDFVATLLVQRGIETFEDAKNFFRPSLDHLHDPYLMKDMDKAVAQLKQPLKTRKTLWFW